MYVGSYEEESNPILVKHLIPRATTEGRRDTSEREENKNMVETLIEIRDDEESDWDSDYSCSY